MVSLFVDVNLYKVKLTLFCDSNCLVIASTVSAYCLRQMLLMVIADSSMRSLYNVLYNCCSSRFDIAFHGI